MVGGPDMALDKKIILGEELESMPTVKGFFDGTLLVFCPTCGAGIPEPDVRYVLKRILQDANPELCKKLFGT
jgi:hypothetical protein